MASCRMRNQLTTAPAADAATNIRSGMSGARVVCQPYASVNAAGAAAPVIANTRSSVVLAAIAPTAKNMIVGATV